MQKNNYIFKCIDYVLKMQKNNYIFKCIDYVLKDAKEYLSLQVY